MLWTAHKTLNGQSSLSQIAKVLLSVPGRTPIEIFVMLQSLIILVALSHLATNRGLLSVARTPEQ